MRLDKPEKIAGYVLLGIALVLIIVPPSLGVSIWVGGLKIPQLVPALTGDDFAVAFATFSNVCLIFFILVTIMWAGSILSSRAVTLIKDVKLKVVKESLGEGVELVKEEKPENL